MDRANQPHRRRLARRPLARAFAGLLRPRLAAGRLGEGSGGGRRQRRRTACAAARHPVSESGASVAGAGREKSRVSANSCARARPRRACHCRAPAGPGARTGHFRCCPLAGNPTAALVAAAGCRPRSPRWTRLLARVLDRGLELPSPTPDFERPVALYGGPTVAGRAREGTFLNAPPRSVPRGTALRVNRRKDVPRGTSAVLLHRAFAHSRSPQFHVRPIRAPIRVITGRRA
jgi:hypothetical protein